ncbi:MAG: hypothetical protein Kow0068_13860 [Marinilabiliales bacterium]
MDPLWEKYPGWNPYNYAANNPIIFVDLKGDSISIDKSIYENKNLANAFLEYLQTDEGYKQIAQFAMKEDKIKIGNSIWEFYEDENYVKSKLIVKLNQNGIYLVDWSWMQTVYRDLGINSIGPGEGQSYILSMAYNDIGSYDFYHEIQHAEIYEIQRSKLTKPIINPDRYRIFGAKYHH